MPRITPSFQTLLLLVVTVCAATLVGICLVPRAIGANIIARWRGMPPGGPDYYTLNMGGGFVSEEWWGGVQSLKKLGPLGVLALCKSLATSDKAQKLNVLMALAAFGPDAEEALPKLIPMLDEEDVDLREEVIGCLAQIGLKAKPAVPKLREILDSLSADGNANKRTILLLELAMRKICVDPLERHEYAPVGKPAKVWPHGSGWVVRLAAALGEGGFISVLALTIVLGTLTVCCFLRDMGAIKPVYKIMGNKGTGNKGKE